MKIADSAAVKCFLVLTLLAAGAARAATFTVANTNDSGPSSLRDAIGQANSNAGPDTIAFAIPGTGPYTIKVSSMLPTITNAGTAVRGDTQPGFSNNTPVIRILGPSGVGLNDYGLWSQAVGTTIRCVRVSGFTTAGILADGILSRSVKVEGCLLDQNADGLHGGGIGAVIGGTSTNLRNVIINNQTNGITLIWGNATIVGNFIGVAADGVTAAGNGENGIRLPYYAGTNAISGATNYPQVISGNGLNGIFGEPNGSYIMSSTDNKIEGNFIGTDVNGTNAIPNGGAGVRLWGGSRNTVGGSTEAKRNVIAGNGAAGVSIEGLHPIYNQGRDNVVIGNYIGLGADGETVLSNYYGVRIYDAFANTVGGTSPGSGNRFGGATRENVLLITTYQPCVSNLVQGNWFGISASTQLLSGALAGVGMSSYEVLAEGTSYNLIGGTTTNARNYFGGANTGVAISGTNSQFNRVVGNWIGVGPGGVQMANNSYGVEIYNAHRNQIGGVYTNEGNVISGNQAYGIRIVGSNSYANVVEGNIIGLDPTSQFAISNRYNGVDIAGGAFSNRVGGTNNLTMNVIAGNAGGGVVIRDAATRGNTVLRNFIGMNRTNAPFGNGGNAVGLYINNSPGNTIGPANYIGNSTREGIYIFGTSSVNNVIIGNIVGQDITGSAQPNLLGGIAVNSAPETLVGTNGGGNYVAGNNSHGISLYGGDGTNSIVRGNFIGMQFPSLNVALPNSAYGIYVDSASVTIGGTNIGDANYVSGNASAGIVIDDGGTNALIVGNIVGLDLTGTAIISNRGAGVSIKGTGVRLGGTELQARNIISGNMVNGVEILGPARDVTVQNCYIGPDINGTTALSNRQYAVYINNATNVTFGGAGATRRNIVTSGRLEGVYVDGNSSNIVIIGNYIGTTANGLGALPNPGGMRIESSHVTIGGTNAQEGNLISGNVGVGIDIYTGSNIRVVGNVVGLASDGVTPLPNTAGIWVYSGASGVTIGGTNAGERNVIARNTGREIEIVGPSAGNRVIGNYIGVQDGGVAFSIGADNDEAIFVNNSPNNQILNNVIGQENIGIQLNGTGTFNTVIRGNYIGEYNLESISNKSWGIQIINSSSNSLGGFTPDERNLIAQNGGGIAVTNSGAFVAVANLLSPNLIFSNAPRLNIEIGRGGFNTNDALDADSGPNNLQNSPVLTNGFTLSGIVYAQGVLTSAPLTTFAVDVYRSGGTNAEGRLYLGRTYVNTDAGGVGKFSAGFAINLAAGTYLASTATDPENNTSEFSASPSGITAKSTADTDGDLIPDYWETLYGLNPAVSNAANSDFDNDGVTDFDEFIADTAPNNSNSFLVVTAIAQPAGMQITFPTSGARTYDFQYANDLLSGTWVEAITNQKGNGAPMAFTDPNAATSRYYRVQVALP